MSKDSHSALPPLESSGLDPLDHEVQYFYAALDAQEVVETQQFTAALQAHSLRGWGYVYP